MNNVLRPVFGWRSSDFCSNLAGSRRDGDYGVEYPGTNTSLWMEATNMGGGIYNHCKGNIICIYLIISYTLYGMKSVTKSNYVTLSSAFFIFVWKYKSTVMKHDKKHPLHFILFFDIAGCVHRVFDWLTGIWIPRWHVWQEKGGIRRLSIWNWNNDQWPFLLWRFPFILGKLKMSQCFQ